jgi:hypothetical protein
MKLDLFELIEGFFLGVVAFFYNLVLTAATLVRHPFRGPAFLYRLYQSKSRRQVGAFTFLFVVFLTIFSLIGGILGSRSASDQLVQALAGSFDRRSWWSALVAALTSTIALDVVVRLKTNWTHPGDRARTLRAEIVARVEFALAIVTCAAAVGILAGKSLLNVVGSNVATRYIIGCIFLLIAMSVVPVMTQFRPGLRPRFAKPRLSFVPGRRRIGTPLRCLAILLLVFTAFLVGGLTYTFTGDAGRVEVTSLRCHLREQRPYVDAVIRNSTWRGVLVDPGDLELDVGDMRLELRAGEDEYGPIYVLGPDETKVVRAWAVMPQTIDRNLRFPPGTRCRLGGVLGMRSGRLDWNTFTVIYSEDSVVEDPINSNSQDASPE